MNGSLQGACIFFFLLITHDLSGQHISGTITNLQGEKVAAANVILKQGDAILSFTITGDKGFFELDIKTFSDSLYLEITHLTYDTKQIWLDSQKSTYNVELVPRSYALPEISVEVPAVTRRGDTLTFSVESYIQEGDETIEEVLRRLPGVTVSDNGAIEYKGLDINKFYIEGLDLLEGRYQIVTKNLGIQHIRDIQVIERYQPVRALDSIYRPENAAINLKLKSDVAITGSMQGELTAPLSGLAATNFFGFAKKYQFTLSGSFNDLGDNLNSNYVALYPTQQVQNTELFHLKKPYRPFLFNNNRIVHDNREFTVGINYLRRLGESIQLKLQGYGLKDQILQNGTSLAEYFLGNQTSTFEEELATSEEPHEWDGRAILEYNGKKLYTRINTQLTAKTNQSMAGNIINDEDTEEFLETDALALNSDLSIILTRNQKAYRLNADIQYEDKDYQLDILNAYVSIPKTGKRIYPALNQVANTQNLLLKLYTSFLFKREYIKGSIDIGPQLSRKTITSSTFDQFEDGHLIDAAYQNDHITHRNSLDIDQEWTYEKDKIRMLLRVPASYDHFVIDNNLKDAMQKKRYLNYQPSLDLDYQFNTGFGLGMRLGYFKDVFTYGDLFYDGLILQSNRNTTTQTREPNTYRGYAATVSLGGINHVKDRYAYVNLTYRNQLADQINNNVFDTTGILSVYNLHENRTKTYRLNVMTKLSSIGSFDYSLQGDYTFRNQDRFINSMLIPFRTHNLNLRPECSFSWDRHATVISSRWTWSKVRETNLQNNQLELGLTHYWQVAPKSGFDLNYRWYMYGNLDEEQNCHLLNLMYRFDWTKYKTKIYVSILNVLNERTFTSYFQGTYFDSFNTFRLNPRRLQLGFKKTL